WSQVHPYFSVMTVHQFDYSCRFMTGLTELGAAVDGLCATEPSALGDGATLEARHPPAGPPGGGGDPGDGPVRRRPGMGSHGGPVGGERVVFAGPDRVTTVGRARRLDTGATRRAVPVPGRECFRECCDQPADRTRIDHIEP